MRAEINEIFNEVVKTHQHKDLFERMFTRSHK